MDVLEQRGTGQGQAARTFDIGLSAITRYLSKSRQGRTLSPGKAPGKRPIIDDRARRLLEPRPFVTSENIHSRGTVQGTVELRSEIFESVILAFEHPS